MASRQVASPTVSRTFANLLLDAITPASVDGHLIDTPKLILLGENSLAISPDTTLAEIEAIEAAFTGYTAGGTAITLTAPGPVRQSETIQLLAGNVIEVLESGSPTVTADIYGAALVDTTYGLIAAGYFDQPVTLAEVGDFIDVLFGVPVILQLP